MKAREDREGGGPDGRQAGEAARRIRRRDRCAHRGSPGLTLEQVRAKPPAVPHSI
jgi:hypothetical protein